MMLEIVWQVCLYTFFIYGLGCFIIQFFDTRKSKEISTDKNICLKNLLIVKNQQDTIEAIIRDILSKSEVELVIIDAGSTDDTRIILEKLTRTNQNVRLVDKEELKSIIK